MTAPAIDYVALAKAERDRKGIHIQKATGCPRRAPAPFVLKPEREYKREKMGESYRAIRNADLKAWYEASDEVSLAAVCALSIQTHGHMAIRTLGSLSTLLRKMGVTMRPQGKHTLVAQLKRDNQMLRMRLAAARAKIAKYEEAA